MTKIEILLQEAGIAFSSSSSVWNPSIDRSEYTREEEDTDMYKISSTDTTRY